MIVVTKQLSSGASERGEGRQRGEYLHINIDFGRCTLVHYKARARFLHAMYHRRMCSFVLAKKALVKKSDVGRTSHRGCSLCGCFTSAGHRSEFNHFSTSQAVRTTQTLQGIARVQGKFAATYQQNCNRWRARESGPLRVQEDLRIIMKPKYLLKAGVNQADIFYLNNGHNDKHLAWSIVTSECIVEES